jgi:hypothetical protein
LLLVVHDQLQTSKKSLKNKQQFSIYSNKESPPNREKERTEKREGMNRLKLETHSNTTVVGFGI